MFDATLYIANEWHSATGPAQAVISPSTEEVIARIPAASESEVDGAVQAAAAARRSWALTPAPERSAYLRRIAEVLLDHQDRLAEILVREVGKPLSDARTDVESSAANLRYVAEWDRRIEGEILPSDQRHETIHLERVPMGVVAAITAWNYPLDLLFRKLAPALVTGNTLVVKPTEVTPLSAIEAVRLIDAHVRLPPGVLNLVTGGAEAGRSLVRHPQVSMVTMTGHRDSGKRIMTDAAANLTRVALELGGCAPAIVWADADVDRAVEALVSARYTNAGQVCTSAERIFVYRDLYPRFVESYAAAAQALRIGPPAEAVDMGPLVSQTQLDKVDRAVRQALADGARLVTGGARLEDLGRGYWYPPTVFADAAPEMAIMREETFGPVAPIMPVDTFEQAVTLANDSRYGLSAFLFTNDYRLAMRAATEIEFGEVYINRTMGEALQGYHTGHRESGLGGEDGKHGVLKFTQLKSVYHYFG